MQFGSGDLTIDLSGTFTDQDGDTLALTASSGDASIARVNIIGTNVVVTPIAIGATNISITADDGKGGLVTDSFILTVNGPIQTNAMFFFGDGADVQSVTKDVPVAPFLRFDYFTRTRFTNGTLVISLEGITATTSDSVNIDGWRSIDASEISEDGHTLTFTGINFSGDIAFEMHNKTYSEGTYIIRAQGDADGIGTTYSADNRTITVNAK
ncbi:BslA/BslB family hydrophobin [Heyndrickxia oleronia]|uniref:Uncharacterized protein n=1 Tax=Heyndrickxia oleronia TaxID=38875 RepID=A0AAW6SUT7_9BACI|nr:BslA/BslB family hydrophobin [Heyndrickxia oleronia]MDH5160324.1 hypothetical protein [Heyndrickxia oleronia]